MKLGKIVVFLQDEEIEVNLDEIVPIGNDTSKEFVAQSSLYAYIAMLAARAEAEYIFAKKERDKSYALTYKEARKDLEMSGEKITEARVTAEVTVRKGYVEAIAFELDCREQFLILQAVERSMAMRADMLVSLGAHQRKEWAQTGMHVKNLVDAKEEIKSSSMGRKKDGGPKPPF